jgi:MATE family multidrug resistance protein
MFIALFSYWGVGLPLECALGFGWFGEPMGVYGFWVGLAVALGVAALLLSSRLWRLSAAIAHEPDAVVASA